MPEAELAMAWFPAGDFETANERWPGFLEWPVDDHADYCARIELELRRYGAQRRIAVAPVLVEDFVRWCDERSFDAGEAESRAKYAGEVLRRGAAIPWPPARNEACWCGTGQKYKWCCGRVGS